MPGYTNIPKPTGASYTNVSRAPTEVPMYGTAVYGTDKYGIIDLYTDISKPTGSIYTNIAKPT